MERRRVVITGMGILSPIGNSVEDAWKNAANGVSGIDLIERFDTTELPVKFGGEVRNFDPVELFGRRDARRMDRLTQFACEVARQAMEDSGLVVTDENHYDVGAIVGTGIGGIESTINGVHQSINKGYRGISPLLVPMMIPDSAAAKVTIQWGLRGPSMAVSTACATSNNALGEAAEMIRRGAADAMIAGSTEAGLVPLAMASFTNMHAISRRNENPQAASRPFDQDRDGFVVAEGGGLLVLEELQHALDRGAHIYGEILGYASTSDAFHITAPLEDGEGAQVAMRKALKNADLTINDIDYINAHGTSTPLNDISETMAIKAVFGEQAYNVPISSTKSMTGHLMGAAGAVEAILSLKAMSEQFIPPTINLDNPQPGCDLNYVPNKGVNAKVDTVMSNSFGFGGHNAVLILGKYQETNGS